MKVLVVEDTVTSATLICHLLNKMGLSPLHAHDGEIALTLFRQEAPDMVLLDIVLPGMDGFEVARRMRQMERDGEWTPILFLSAKASDADIERGIEVGGDDYLVKPVSEVVLKSKVRAMQRIAQMRYSLLVLTRKLNDANRELSRLSSVDGLTGIANRRAFDETLQREWARASRQRSALSLLLIDVDHFKQYNDLYGHQAGDECLKQVAQTLSAGLHRPADLVARYGGEEFGLILPDTPVEGALQVATSLVKAVHTLAIPHQKAAVDGRLTISVGVCSMHPVPERAQGWVELLQRADLQLYRAKREGRNRAAIEALGDALSV